MTDKRRSGPDKTTVIPIRTQHPVCRMFRFEARRGTTEAECIGSYKLEIPADGNVTETDYPDLFANLNFDR